jgi:hypothetical protein
VHTVADVHCLGCNDRIGWYYLKASNHSQKYKEGEHVWAITSAAAAILIRTPGKYMLEREKLVKENSWQVDES